MTTGKEVFERAMQLLGYVNTSGEPDSNQYAELYKRATPIVQQITDDLKRLENPLSYTCVPVSLTAALPLSAATINDIMPYGVAMLLAQSENNGDSQSLFSELYNQKRSSVPKTAMTITDIFAGSDCL